MGRYCRLVLACLSLLLPVAAKAAGPEGYDRCCVTTWPKKGSGQFRCDVIGQTSSPDGIWDTESLASKDYAAREVQTVQDCRSWGEAVCNRYGAAETGDCVSETRWNLSGVRVEIIPASA